MRGYRVSEQSAVLDARREADTLARQLGFSEEDRGRVAIVATELGTNLIKHAEHGEILVGVAENGGAPCVEMFAIDKGPGMSDIEACLADGFSTAGSRGTGLGAMRRQASSFDIFSVPDAGTVIHTRVCAAKAPYARRDKTEWAALRRAMPGEVICGDDFATRETGGAFVAMLADGLGHGVFAAQAASEAVALFERDKSTHADMLVEAMHLGLRATRGAAIAVASADFASRVVTYSGIGNIAGSLLFGGNQKKMVTRNGTAGLVARQIQGFQYPYVGDALLIMHSDGMSSNWSLDRYPGLFHRAPALIAAVLYRDFGRERDDASVLVARLAQ